MDSIPLFPACAPFSVDFKAELEPILQMLGDGISELTFFSLLIHTPKHNYRVTKTARGVYLLFRTKNGADFFVPINGCPSADELCALKETGAKPILVSRTIAETYAAAFTESGFTLTADRANDDYLYNKTELSELKGKAFHKKKNHLNTFNRLYNAVVKPLDAETAKDAQTVLEVWQQMHAADGITDYETAAAALALIGKSPFCGSVVYIEAEPVGWYLGEFLCGGTMFCTHFEKGIDSIKGIYQFLNWHAASTLPDACTLINREQDLGDEGMRQAKLTYRPCGFVHKFRAE